MVYFKISRKFYGGGGGIRTHGTLSRTPVFKTGALNRSATPPAQAHSRNIRRCRLDDGL